MKWTFDRGVWTSHYHDNVVFTITPAIDKPQYSIEMRENPHVFRITQNDRELHTGGANTAESTMKLAEEVFFGG